MGNTSDSKQEERIAAINYVITFYKDLQSLLHYYSLLVNAAAELQINKDKLTDEQKQQLTNLVQNTRYHATKCKIFVDAMSEESKLNKDLKKKIDTAYKTATENFILKDDGLTEYVSLLNKFFVQNVAKHILKNNVELISEIYGGGQS